MAAGEAYMNQVTVQQTAQGLSQYILKSFPDNFNRGVVIGYDARYNSL